MGSKVGKETVIDIVKKMEPEPLSLPMPPRIDHADHIIKTSLMGWTKLAADHILHPQFAKIAKEVFSSLIRRVEHMLKSEKVLDHSGKLNEEVVLKRFRIYDTLFEIIFNLSGAESKWAGYGSEDAENLIRYLTNALDYFESLERQELGEPVIMEAVIDMQLNDLMKINKGKSLAARVAQEVSKKIDRSSIARSYINAMASQIRNLFYRKAYEAGLCKFGNDYALGLRFLRHLGFVQVSTNPPLAAVAYNDDPELLEKFKKYAKNVLAKEHPEWFKEPEKYADDIAMEATRFALMDNFYVFRVPFILSKYHDGLVSYQLNPLIANDVEKSVEAVKTFVSRLERDLGVYDEYLWWGYNVPEKGRANLVVKVAAAYPAAIDIAERINEMGVGQNITVSFTVSQEVVIGFAAIRGMAKAIRKGIIPTQTYDTNMGGRLEDHLREEFAAQLLLKAMERADESKRNAVLEKLAKGLGVKDNVWQEMKKKDLKSVASFLTSRRVLGRNLLRDTFIDALVELGLYKSREDALNNLQPIEEALRLSGTFVAQRVYEIMFAPWNREKWINYLIREYGLTREEAELVMDRIDLLPASKRKPIDTLYTFASRNMTNTEFPDHQLSVTEEVTKKNIALEDLRESIYQQLPRKYLEILMQMEDFVKAYEASPEVNELLKKAGIDRDYGSRGLGVNEWPSYGPSAKTMHEFTEEYLTFRSRIIDALKSLA
ncbi:MAG: transaldolase family protein [Ignisphaera sp.]